MNLIRHEIMRSTFLMRSHRSMSGGILDRVRQGMEDRRKRKQTEAFDKQLEMFLEYDDFDLKTFRQQLEDGIKEGGWKLKIPGENKKQLEAMKKQIGIMNHFTPRELTNHKRIDGTSKARVAEASGVSAEDIYFILKQFRMMKDIHSWLKKRQSKGLSIPNTMDEATQMAMSDPRGFERPRFRKRQ